MDRKAKSTTSSKRLEATGRRETDVCPDSEAALIDIADLQEARCDPRVHGFLREAKEYGAHLGRVEATGRQETDSAAALIDANELQEARCDPRVHGFLREAQEYGARLDHEGRSR